MTNPCRRHFQRVTAAIEAASVAGPQQSMAGATSYELQMAKLLQDRLRLKQVQSNAGKAELKRQLLPEYIPYVDGVLSAGNGAQDEVLTTVMVWRLDAGDFTGALDIADYVLKHGMVMPDRFARTTGCLVAEEIATAALNAQKANGRFDLDTLTRTAALTSEQDMPDEARAKLILASAREQLAMVDHQAAQLSDADVGQLQAGIAMLKRAIELHNSCGGKKDLEKAERLLKKHAGPTS